MAGVGSHPEPVKAAGQAFGGNRRLLWRVRSRLAETVHRMSAPVDVADGRTFGEGMPVDARGWHAGYPAVTSGGWLEHGMRGWYARCSLKVNAYLGRHGAKPGNATLLSPRGSKTEAA